MEHGEARWQAGGAAGGAAGHQGQRDGNAHNGRVRELGILVF